jgi:acetolactate synthase regulatory subunit
MCRLNIEVDQSIHTVGRVFDVIEASCFHLRSINVVPVAWTRKASVRLNLVGGSGKDLDRLVADLQQLPAVISIQDVAVPA